ncbi:uncharacterized protein LOC131148268 [Malania oleifera]|uniref:uncharacterized protein LOC131148268 n=1 Tax=Malania oleifera TaxID=397392 RepID=UPI0025AE2CE1|nr:uncharacterized protein LOC131148268 [Malania oleifera]
MGASSEDEIDTYRLLRGIACQVREEMRRDFGGTSYPPVHQSCTINQFTHLKPSSFEGGTNPIKAEMWMQEMEKILVVLNCTEEQKVLFATFKLVGEAERWWHAMKLLEEQRVVPIAMTRVILSRSSMTNIFLPPLEMQRWKNFFSLTQGRFTIQQYAARFLELSRFAPSVIQEFTELVEKATVAEFSLQRSTEAFERRKRPASPRSQSNVKKGLWRGDRDVLGQGSERKDQGRQGDSSRPHCPRCNQRHWGECRGRSVICYRCGKQGHIARECREPPSNALVPNQNQN